MHHWSHSALTDFISRADDIFLTPCPTVNWKKIVDKAVGGETFRGFHRKNVNDEGASQVFKSYFKHQRCRIIDDLSQTSCAEQLHVYENVYCEEIRACLTNIKCKSLQSYNKVRKPVDLYLEHLVAMADDPHIACHRERLIPLLFLPLDSQMFSNPSIFPLCKLKEYGLGRGSTYGDVEGETTYRYLQEYLASKAACLSQISGMTFNRIYFDMFWNDRYLNSGGNLFKVYPE